jgi:hypothetical protein
MSHSHRSSWLPGLIALACATFAPSALAQTVKIDDGTPGYSLSYAIPDDLCWMNRLSTAAPLTVSSVEIMFGTLPVGHPVRICVWRDLGGYGDPNQSLLVSSVQTTVKNPDQFTFARYDVPPVSVSGFFFVGAVLATDANFAPSTMDPHTPNSGRAWYATGWGPGTFDPSFPGSFGMNNVATLGIQGVFMIRANGANGPTPEVYCTSKQSSGGCVPTLTLSGAPDVNAGSGFTLTAALVPNQKTGLLFYSLLGRQNVAFGGGSLCVVPPLRRTGALQSAGSPTGNDCTGSFVFDFNTFAASGLDPALVAGTTVDAQFWYRDPGFAAPQSLGLTRAAHFGLAP